MTRHRFTTGERGRVWVGDLLFHHTRRVKGRGWRHRGQHFDKPLTVADIQESLRPEPPEAIPLAEAIPLGIVFRNVKFYGVASDGEPSPAAIILTPQDAPTGLPTLVLENIPVGPPGLGLGRADV